MSFRGFRMSSKCHNVYSQHKHIKSGCRHLTTILSKETTLPDCGVKKIASSLVHSLQLPSTVLAMKCFRNFGFHPIAKLSHRPASHWSTLFHLLIANQYILISFQALIPNQANEAFDEKMKSITQCLAYSQETQRHENFPCHRSFEHIPKTPIVRFFDEFFEC